MFPYLLAFIVVQRLAELVLARSNERRLKARGAVEVGASHYPYMMALHTFWLLSCLVEWWTGPGSQCEALFFLGLGLFLTGQALRWTTIWTLGRRWTTRVIVLPGAPLVKKGLFRWVSHPNYLGVVAEIFGVPLLGGCVKTSLLFGVLNLVLLRHRISIESRALAQASGEEHE